MSEIEAMTQAKRDADRARNTNDALLARINRAVEYINDLDRQGSIDHDAATEIKRRLLKV